MVQRRQKLQRMLQWFVPSRVMVVKLYSQLIHGLAPRTKMPTMTIRSGAIAT